MTLRELSGEIFAMGFDAFARLDTSLLFAAKRALYEIYRELRITNTAKLYVTAKLPTSKVKRLHHKGGGAEALPLSGKAYAMTASGKGCITVFDGANSKKFLFDSDSKVIKGFLKYGGRAVFSGEASFDVYNIVTFDEIFGEDETSIPNGDKTVTIKARDVLHDFLCFISPPLDAEGKLIGAAVLEDGAITLPTSYDGDINIKYQRLPTPPSLSEPDAEIDIPREYEMLLPLLTAFYVLLDDNEELAETYKKTYLEMLKCFKKGTYSLSYGGYADVNGWGK